MYGGLLSKWVSKNRSTESWGHTYDGRAVLSGLRCFTELKLVNCCGGSSRVRYYFSPSTVEKVVSLGDRLLLLHRQSFWLKLVKVVREKIYSGAALTFAPRRCSFRVDLKTSANGLVASSALTGFAAPSTSELVLPLLHQAVLPTALVSTLDLAREPLDYPLQVLEVCPHRRPQFAP